jgi:hypothetical protein
VILADGALAGYAMGAGLDAPAAVIAVAIALAESGGDDHAYNYSDVTEDESYGPWQINMYGALGPPRRAQWHLSSNAMLFDPAINAFAMASLSRGGSAWSDWSTYNHNLHVPFLDRAEAAVASPIGGGEGDVGGIPIIGGVLAGGEAIGKFFMLLTDGHTWVRLLWIIGGAALVAAGIAILNRDLIAEGAEVAALA